MDYLDSLLISYGRDLDLFKTVYSTMNLDYEQYIDLSRYIFQCTILGCTPDIVYVRDSPTSYLIGGEQKFLEFKDIYFYLNYNHGVLGNIVGDLKYTVDKIKLINTNFEGIDYNCCLHKYNRFTFNLDGKVLYKEVVYIK
jgi:hypothetical protein